VTGTTGMTDAASYQTPITMRDTHHASRNHPETRPDEPYAPPPRRQDGQDQEQHPAREATAARPDPAPAPLPVRTGRQHPGPATPTHALMLDPDDHAPRHARAATRTSLTLWGLAHLTDDAQAITSELVANAAAASRRTARPGKEPAPILVWLTTSDGHLIIRVWDPDPTAPPRDPPEPDPGKESGRGLIIVAVLAAWWDCTPAPNGGKHVRAALPIHAQPPAR
jgi:hypothetical protein